MRAAILRNHQFQVEELPTPQPGPGQVLVKVRACGICGSDMHIFKHADHLVDQARKLGTPALDLERGLVTGLVLGHEFVGEIVEFGPDTTKAMKIGDRVCSMPFVLKDTGPALLGSSPETSGAYAEYMILTEALCLKVDDSIPDQAAALTEPLGIGIHAVNKAALQTDDVAVVIGCGPIGLAITAVLKMRGVKHIFATDLSSSRRKLAETMGATQVVNGREASAVTTAAREFPAARLVIFENTGAPGMLGRLIVEAPQNARIIVSGIAAGEESVIPILAIMKELQIAFIIYYTADEFAEALAAIRDGKLNWQALVTSTVSLEEVNSAFETLGNSDAQGKIIILPHQAAIS